MIHEINNSVIAHLVTKLRNQNTRANDFRFTISQIAKLLFYEAFQDEVLNDIEILTWRGKKVFKSFDESKYVFIPILRAALPMLDGINELMPDSTSGFIAMKRDEETFKSHLYYDRVPDLKGKTAVVCDPMLATGGSLSDAIDAIKNKNPKRIISLNIIAAPDGIELIKKNHPDIELFVAKIDQKLENAFIIPGIGDAGDRAFNTL
ncbi:MAG: uracil phosphoribosyltransferase [Campylobacterota bacterium]|nr:uracil phosphoribosyltransferase [Campylobacterota bacterium]